MFIFVGEHFLFSPWVLDAINSKFHFDDCFQNCHLVKDFSNTLLGSTRKIKICISFFSYWVLKSS